MNIDTMASPENVTEFAEFGDCKLSSLGHDDFVVSPEEDPQEVIIAVAGKSGAGKTSLANKTLGRKIKIKISPDPTTEKCEILLDINEGIRLTIIDNPGLMTGKEQKRIQELCLCSRRKFFSPPTVCQLPQQLNLRIAIHK